MLVLFATAALSAQMPVSGPFVIFIGPPGSGRATQAAAAGKMLKLPVISVDNLIAVDPAAFNQNHNTGLSGMERDSDPFLNDLFQQRLLQPDILHGMILEGYPNTKDHANLIAKLVTENQLPKPLIIRLMVPDDVSRKRLPNDPPASVEQRLKDYHREMDMIHVYFPTADIREVDGTPSGEKVTKKVEAILNERYKKN